VEIAKRAGLEDGSVSPPQDRNRHDHHDHHNWYGYQDSQCPEVTRQTLHHRCLHTNTDIHWKSI